MVISGGFAPLNNYGGPALLDDGPDTDAGMRPFSDGPTMSGDLDTYNSGPEMGSWSMPGDGLAMVDGNDGTWMSPGDVFSGSDNGSSGGDFNIDVNYKMSPESDIYVGGGDSGFGISAGDFGFGFGGGGGGGSEESGG